MHLIYLVGIPGSGKTTTVRTYLDKFTWPPATERHLGPCLHYRCTQPMYVEHAADALDPPPLASYPADLWVLGEYAESAGPFGGTDRLSMSVQPLVIKWLQDPERLAGCTAMLGEGDRLANVTFLNAAKDAGHTVTLVHFDLPVRLAAERMAARAAANGAKQQNGTWWKGRVTKVENLVNSRPVTRINAQQPPDACANDLANIIAATSGAVPSPEVTTNQQP